MICEQIIIPMPWGFVKGQIFGDKTNPYPILCLHGYLDNSNSFKPLAPYLTQNKDYYLVAIDFPGQGLSSKLSDPFLYNFKTFLFCIRKIILYLNLKKPIFLTHSFGCTLSLIYLSCFPEDASMNILIDFVFDLDNSNKDLTTSYRESIEKFLESEKNEHLNISNSQELTYDMAVQRILKANRHIDELSGKILLERSLICIDGKLEFSRDINIPKHMPIKYHHSEFMNFYSNIIKNIKIPIYHLYAYPYPFGENTFKFVDNLLEQIKQNSNKNLEVFRFDGSHHFHMIEPKKASDLILKYLQKEKINIQSSSKL